METTVDRFLGGRIVCAQPVKRFRAGHDTVLLAAAVPATAGEHVLELGSGAGVASLCLAARVPGVDISGIEIDSELVALANANAERNTMTDRVRFVEGDVLTPCPPLGGGPKREALRGGEHVWNVPSPKHLTTLDVSTLPQGDGKLWDHIFFNPPFHPGTGDVSPSAAKDRAMRGDDIALWWRQAVDLATSVGTITAILRADRVDEIRTGEGALTILPLAPREGEPAKRAIVQLRKGVSASSRTLAPMILHRPDGKPTDAAEAVLRHAAAITL